MYISKKGPKKIQILLFTFKSLLYNLLIRCKKKKSSVLGGHGIASTVSQIINSINVAVIIHQNKCNELVPITNQNNHEAIYTKTRHNVRVCRQNYAGKKKCTYCGFLERQKKKTSQFRINWMNWRFRRSVAAKCWIIHGYCKTRACLIPYFKITKSTR